MHEVKPTLHWQLPATQNWLNAQVLLQLPQLVRSDCRSRQMPAQ